MDLENTQNNSLAKLPLLKQGEYDTWRLRIESYIQLQDYTLWEIIEEGNSFKPVARTTTNEDGTSTTTIPGAVTAEQKILKKNDLKARSILMMTLPSEHLLTFNKHKDAKSLFEAIEARFGGNEATKKTQKTLLKQMYETFNASSSESLDSIFNRLQKIISQLTILGEIITPEDLNLKFLRSLPTEWGMHVVVWRNKSDLGSISFDDLYNNFKIVEPEVKRSVTSSSNSGSQNLAFLSGHSSTNDVNTANVHVSTGSTPVSTASTNNSTACLSDATVYAYLATQPNGSQVVHEDLEQIYEDDLDEIDLKWQLTLLSMKARKFYQRTGKKIIINGSDTAGYDKKKVECFNCHKLGHFARECRNPRSQENRNRSQDSSRRTVNVEESYYKNSEYLKSKYDKLRIELNKSESDLDSYKKGLASVEEQLVFYKKNESMLCVVLKRDASFKDSEINALNIQIEKLKKEKESNQIKIDNFENASKSLDKLIGSQISNNNRKGYGLKANKSVYENSSNEIKKTTDAPIIEDWVSDCDEDESEVMENFSNSRRNFAPKEVLIKSGIVPINAARQSSSRAATPVSTARLINTATPKPFVKGDPQVALKDTRIFDSGCSRHMTGNKSHLTDYQEYDGGFVAFAGSSKGGKISRKGKIVTGKLDFKDVYFVEELKFNLFSVSQMCDKQNSVLFTETECLVLSPDFKLPDESQVLLKVPRKNNMYSFDLKNVVPSKGLTCLFAKATNDESKLWHMRLAHIKFKTMNKLVKGNLVRGLPLKIFENDHTCVACQKGKQHKTSLVTDDYSRFSWVFFLAKKDETSRILKDFITGIENQLNHKVKIIRCDNGTEFKNYEMNQFCGIKGIKREFSNARTPQQNGVAERKNRTLIEAARTMVLVTKLHNKTPYELLIGRTPIISFMRPFGCPVTILNTLDHLGKFDGKADEGFLVGNRTNGNAGLETNSDAGQAGKEKVPDQEYILPLLHTSSNVPSSSEEAESSPKDDAGKKNEVKDPTKEGDMNGLGKATNTNSTNRLNTVSSPVNTVSSSFTTEDPGKASAQRNEFESLFEQDKDNNNAYRVFTPVNADTPSNVDYPIDPLIPDLEDTVNL
ncbi:putative ribonuclease H-like domain-containing protein [Tanacetum coccineum]